MPAKYKIGFLVPVLVMVAVAVIGFIPKRATIVLGNGENATIGGPGLWKNLLGDAMATVSFHQKKPMPK
jgi:hypothetical protein